MGDLNRAELLQRLEALEQRVGTGPGIPGDVERFAHFSDALLFHCEECRAVNVPVDVWDVGRRVLQENGYETLYSVSFHSIPGAPKDEEKERWKRAEDQAYALVQVLDALPSLIQRLREDVQEGEKLPSVDGVDLVLGPGRVWVDPQAKQENGVYEVTVVAPPGCEVHRQSSRVCERGTKGCLFSHTGDGDGQQAT